MCDDHSVGMDSHDKHQASLGLDPTTLTVTMVLQRNDTFSSLMEYLESVNAPPYLRFWTNADIYKQFSLMSLNETGAQGASLKALKATMRTDAMYVFDAHFGPKAELPVWLTMDREAHHDAEGHTIVDILLNDIRSNPNPNCFQRSQQYVLRILDRQYFSGFKTSPMFQQYARPSAAETKTPEPAATSLTPSLAERELGDIATLEPVEIHSDDHLSVNTDDSFDADAAFAVDEPRGRSRASSALNEGAPSTMLAEGDMSLMRDEELEPLSPTPEALRLAKQMEEGADDPLVHLAAEVTRLREQLLYINASIDVLRPQNAVENLNMENNNRLRKLKKSRKDLEQQIEKMMQMANEMAADEASRKGSVEMDPSSAQSSRMTLDVPAIDLENVMISVIPMIPEEPHQQTGSSSTNPLAMFGKRITTTIATGSHVITSLASTGSFPGNSLNVQLKTMVFEVLVTATGKSAKSWTLHKMLDDFANMHRMLCKSYSKAEKIPFPVVQKPSSVAGETSAEQKERRLHRFCRDLQGYLQIVLLDRILSESRPVQKFFQSYESATRASSVQESTQSLVVEESAPRKSMELEAALAAASDIPMRSSSTESLEEDSQQQDLPEPAAPTDLSTLSDADLPLLIDTAFALVTDVFDLHNSRQWLRRKALAVLRQLLLQSSQDRSGRVHESLMMGVRWWVDACHYASEEEKIVAGLQWVQDSYWPGDIWFSTVEPDAPPVDEKQVKMTKRKAREALLRLMRRNDTFGPDTPADASSSDEGWSTVQFYLHRIVGRQNAEQGIERVFNMLQHDLLNRSLVLSLLEVMFKLVFADDRRKYR